MGYRDRSQGFAFVYADLAKLLRERDQIDINSSSPLYGASPSDLSVNLSKDAAVPAADSNHSPTHSQASETQEMPIPLKGDQKQSAVRQIRANLDRLQSLHHKLHAMLEELNQVTNKKKKE